MPDSTCLFQNPDHSTFTAVKHHTPTKLLEIQYSCLKDKLSKEENNRINGISRMLKKAKKNTLKMVLKC